MADDGSIVTKAAEKLSGALEKLVDNRMLVLGVSLILYLDIWMIHFNVDMGVATFDTAVTKLKFISIRTIITFIVSYSMIMTVAMPAVRYVYNWYHLYYGEPRGADEPRTQEERRLSDWALAVISFSIWDGLTGLFKSGEGYDGLMVFICNGLSPNGVVPTIFRLCLVFFLWFCVMMALEKDY